MVEWQLKEQPHGRPRKVANQLSGFTTLMNWVSRHHKLDLPLRYVMEIRAVQASPFPPFCDE